MKTKKNLTDRQIECYRLVSGEFDGLPTDIAAKLMGISTSAINRLLARAEKICPSLFPILSKQEADVAALLRIGWNSTDIANQLSVTLSRISQITNSLYGKRDMGQHQPMNMVRYESWMDAEIKEKF